MVRGFCCHLVGTWGSLKRGLGSRNDSEKQSLWNLSPKGSKWLLTEMCVIFSLLSCCLKCKQKLEISLASQASLFISYFWGVWAWCDTCHPLPWRTEPFPGLHARVLACACVCAYEVGGWGSDPLEAWCPIKGGQA